MKKTPEEHEAILKDLSRQFGMSIVEIANLARLMAALEIDPLKETGEPFVFQGERPRTAPFGSREEDFDLCWFNTEVPPPDALLNLFDAFEECRRDTERCAMLLNDDLSIERLRAISLNQHSWQRFWA